MPGHIYFLLRVLLLASLAIAAKSVGAQSTTPIKMEAASISVTGSKPSGSAAGGSLSSDWTRVNFTQPFSRTPYVFTVPTNQGSNAGAHRIRDISSTGFYIRSVEPYTFDGAHTGMQVTYLAIESCSSNRSQCEVSVPLSGGSSENWQIGHIDTSRWVGWGQDADSSSNWQSVLFSPAFSSTPAVLAQIQTLSNEWGISKSMPKSRPWLTSAMMGGGTGGMSLALERSEATESDTVSFSERIAWIAAPPGGRKNLLDANNQSVGYEIIRSAASIKGWDDGCVYTNFAVAWSSTPQVIASLNTRNNREPSSGNGTKGDGGWLRRCQSDSNIKTRTGYLIDETHHKNKGQDNNRTRNSGEIAGIFAFERSFSIDPIALDHYRVIHDGSGQTCAPESITLKACADSACSGLYTGSVSLGLTPDANDANATWSGSGVSGDVVSFSNGQATVSLVYNKAGSISLAAMGSPIAPNGYKCEENGAIGAGSCTLDFTQCTIRPFEACDNTTSPCDENGTNLFTKIAGNGAIALNLIKIQTSGTNKGKLESSFATSGSKTVTVDLVTGSSTIDAATGCPTGAQQVAGSNIGNASFTGGRANGVVVLPLASNTRAVKDARVRFLQNPGNITSCTTDSFTIRPAYFIVSSSAASSTKTLPGATGTSLAAGSSFALDAQATSASGDATSGYDGTPSLDVTNVASCMADSAANDMGACPNALSTTRLAGTFSSANASTGKAGGNFAYDEAGGFQLLEDAIIDANFAASDAGNQGCMAGETSNTPGTDDTEADYGKVGCTIGSQASGAGSQAQFGRFYPALFSLDSGTISAGCGTFTYIGQKFGLTASLSARSQGDTKTLTRYRSGQLELAATRSADLSTNLYPTTVSTNDSSPAWSNGIANVSWSKIEYAKSATSPLPPVADLQLGLRVVDGDNRPMKNADLLSNYKQIAGASPELRYGRLRISNNFGARSPLQLPVRTEYWSQSTWVPSTADNCTNLNTANFVLGGAIAGDYTASFAWPGAGSGTLTLTRNPGSTQTVGTIDVAANLGSSGNDNSCILPHHGGTAASHAWLRSRNGNCATTYDRDPSARATFGIYAPETKKTIHARELY